MFGDWQTRQALIAVDDMVSLRLGGTRGYF